MSSRAPSCPRWPCICFARTRTEARPPETPSPCSSVDSSAPSSGSRAAYRSLLTRLLSRQGAFVSVFFAACLPRVGPRAVARRELLPVSDNGQFILHLRAKTGMRIEETARLADLVEAAIRREIPASELNNIIDNIGLPYSTINYMYSRSGFIGTADADILVTLKEGHRPTEDYMRALRAPAAPGVSRRRLLFRARRHRDADPELRPSRAHRRADRGHRHRGQPADRQQDPRRPSPGARPHRSADPSELRLSEAAGERGPHQGRGGRLHAARRREQRASLAQREQSGLSRPVPQLAERGELQPDRPGSAILDPVPPGSAEHSHQRELHGASPDPGRHGLHRALERHGGDLALQHPARGGHLRLRAGPGSRRGGPRHHAHRGRPSSASAPG